jgi:iron(III) transport system permease protein
MSLQTVASKQAELGLARRQRKARRRLNPTHGLLRAIASLVGLVMLLPVAYLLVRTVGAGEAALDILLKPSTLQTIGRTIWLAGSVTLASILLAVPLGWLTTCTDLPGRHFWKVVTALPLVLPSFVAAYLLASMLGPKGLLQQLLEPMTGIGRLPEIYGFPGAFIVLTLMSYPYVLITVQATFKGMDPAQVEAARSLGLSAWGAFRRVTLPQLRPSIVAGSLLVMLYVLRDFGAVTLMRYNTFTRMIYVQYQSFASRSLAAALAMVLIGMTALILYLELRTRGRAQYSRRSVGAARQRKLVRLGWWRWPSLLFVGGVVLVALVGPGFSLLYWLVRGWLRGQELAALWQSSWSSVAVSLATAIVAILAALPVAILSVRKPGRYSVLLERVTYAGYALPGIVVALAFVFFGTQFALALYQTLPMLVLAYTVLFVPQAVGATRASLLQVPKCLEEAGRSLGQTPEQVFRRITFPLLRPGVLAGFALVFLTCMKELPATLILSPIGFGTLATAVWSNISEAFFAQAAAPALMIILLSSLPLAVLTLRDK